MSDPRYPNFAGKHAEDPFFSGAEYIEYAKRVGRIPVDLVAPDGVIVCYQRSIYEHVLALHGLDRKDHRLLHGMAPIDGGLAIVGGFGIGAPVAATVLEEMAAIGVGRFVSMGTAGSLQKMCGIGDVIVCDRAIRDEGVSHHYVEPGMYSHADPALTDALHDRLGGTRGTSWTIDTPFRETVAEARHYQAEGVLCVEMEAAALFAVAERLGVAIGSAFTISDSLADLVWDPQFHSTETEQGLVRIFEAAVEVLSSV